MSSGPYAFPSFLGFADHQRILFGSDFPYAPAPVAAKFTKILDNQAGLTAEQKTVFNKGNGEKLLKRLA